MTKPDNPVLMGVIGAPHGVRGELRVKPYTADPMALGDYGTLFDSEGRAFDVIEIRPQKTVVVVTFEQVRDRSQAEALNGVELFISRDQLPDEELEEDEFFVADLVGLDAHDETGAKTGQVIAVHNFGAGDLLEVAPVTPGGGLARKRAFLVEFSLETVPDIDFEGGRLTLIRPHEIEARGEEADTAEDGEA
ncbi:ribosome maturation factor RimM [Oricola sp.]|uniref:ribosome maturation factor RimM n=1 Tax=Oricola sp. TaxID=1979950 RepID=UPI0025EB3411|nr:ribosome maturation factor RimM [Oricola sp.]MCI5075000.1 ribosome maturation factor RimM [Oricola sp.]